MYNYADPEAIAAIRHAHPGGVDVPLDCVSAENWASYIGLVRPGGHAMGITPPLPEGPAGVERFELFSRGDRTTLAAVVELVERSVLHIHVGGRYPLAKAQRAQDQLATRRGRAACYC